MSSNAYFTKEKEHDFLEITTKHLTLISSLAIIFGSCVVLFYLKSIQHPNVFADIIGSPYSFIAIIAVFILLFLLIYIPFIISHLIILSGKIIFPTTAWKEFLENKTPNKAFVTLFFPHAIYTFLLIAFSIIGILGKANIENCIKCLPWVTAASSPLPLFWYFLTNKPQTISKRNNNYLPVFFILFLASLIGFFTSNYIALHIIQWAPTELNQILMLASYEFMISANLLFTSPHLSPTGNQKNKRPIISVTTALSFYLLLTISLIFVENFPFRLLHPIYFVESPDDASWYLIHRNSNGINSEDLKKIKSNFICLSSGQQNEKTKPKHICTEEANQRHNALFGYMAWNLGSVKVFCPITVKNNITADKIGDTTHQCLTIEGKALQKMHGEHIGYSRTP